MDANQSQIATDLHVKRILNSCIRVPNHMDYIHILDGRIGEAMRVLERARREVGRYPYRAVDAVQYASDKLSEILRDFYFKPINEPTEEERPVSPEAAIAAGWEQWPPAGSTETKFLAEQAAIMLFRKGDKRITFEATA